MRYISPGISLDPGGVTIEGEAVVNHVLSVTDKKSALAPGLQATAGAFDIVVTLTYNDVRPILN
jgi:hypothetical protein